MDETVKLLPCPFCRHNLVVNGEIARCATLGCWVSSRNVLVPLDVPRQVAEWNTRAHPPAPPEGWQPIETAPRDGTGILLYCPNFYFGAGVYIGWWGGSFFEVCTEGQTNHPYSDDGATPWMPLPAPPAPETPE